ncbi:hypothetical protein SAY87_007345 [Trapa incisa]|uniref:acid phosphatase n=1 Tax=Trapa incisa TaxID=236973 RepID=A0AAN7Q0S2_9MYRT|nr:hypothetical protein SAY87_007345 [Trapa incisa]
MGGTGLPSIPPRSSSSVSSFTALLVLVLVLILNGAMVCYGGKTSTFVRKVEKAVDMPLDSDVFQVPSGYNAPQQVHITQGDQVGKAVIVSWVTVDEPGSSVVLYWSENSHLKKKKAEGKYETYKFHNYNSGYIHHCTVRNLEYSTKYYYEVGIEHTVRSFWFITPPAIGPDVPYTFGLIGDLGQSYDSNTTLTHYERNPQKGRTVLFVGDLMTEPQPEYSAYREASFGHAVFDIKNRTHAYYSWHRNQDGYAVEADRLWFYNRYWKPVHEPTSF